MDGNALESYETLSHLLEELLKKSTLPEEILQDLAGTQGRFGGACLFFGVGTRDL